MKKISTCLLAVILLVGLFSGCAVPNSSDDGKIKVYTSFYPMYDFAKKIGGDRIALENMVPTGTEPHEWEPSSGDMAKLEKADVFIYHGAGMEHWTDKVLKNISNQNMVAIEAAKDIPLIEDGSAHDAHAWLSIKNAKQELAAIRDGFSKADPEGAQVYQENYNKWEKEFDALDTEYRETLSSLSKKDIIVSHQAFGYLCRDYGLNQMAISGLDSSSEPSPARMAEIIRFAKDNGIRIIFAEELASEKVPSSIAREIGGELRTLNPLEGLSKEEEQSGADYLSVMRENLNSLKEALS
jgi:zinc transport system substrate-binding protein